MKGLPICPGVGIGHVHIADPDLAVQPIDLTLRQMRAEKARYTAAVGTTRHRLLEHVATVHGQASSEIKAILEIHEALLNDDSFHDQVRKRIIIERKDAAWCLWQEATSLISRFDAMRDPYFAARSEDVRDMSLNLLGVLSGGKGNADRKAEKDHILVSRYLHSSDAIFAQRNDSRGFASESRALVSHAAILLKGFAMPSVGGIDGLLDQAREGDPVVVDGTNGAVILRPAAATIEALRLQKETAAYPDKTGSVGCVSADGTRIVLKANIENPDQVKLMLQYGLDGIGLFRTEFLVSAEGQMPTEQAQYAAYRAVIENAHGRVVTIRTFDIGGDKTMGLAVRCTGRNPVLGLRGIRRHLAKNPDELRTQFRAIFRAAADAPVGILIPMVTTVEDIVETKRHWVSVGEELERAGIAHSRNVVLGAMIETPAAAAAVADIISEVSFISLGTNDLLQFFMAADRDNESVLNYQDATHPAFLWLLRHVIEQVRSVGREADVTVCGEVASDMRVFPHLVRMGYRSFSVSPVSSAAFRSVCADVDLNETDKGESHANCLHP
ncbi:MAG: phosphoenolpyruvate--protein phosphotransferase [Victivallales bacterium]|nr:phosphoenolpyruvate--protein phosphotransferase [Victivallales bacterium]